MFFSRYDRAINHHKTLSCNFFGVHVSLVHSLTLLWPNHLNWSVCIVSMIGLILNSSYMSALRIMSILVTPFTNLNTFISAAVILLFNFFVNIQDSCPYNSIGLIMVMCIRSLALFGICRSFNRRYILPTFWLIFEILQCISSSMWHLLPVIHPRYLNVVTWLSWYSSSVTTASFSVLLTTSTSVF